MQRGTSQPPAFGEVLKQRLAWFREKCRELGLAVTPQRLMIYRILAESEKHPTPEAVYERVRRRMPTISLATVYKSIHTFVEAGLIRPVGARHDSLRLDANLTRHDHLVCRSCMNIDDLPSGILDPVQVPGRLPGGFQAERYRVDLWGLCAECASREELSNQN